MPKAMPLSLDNTGPESPGPLRSLESLVGDAQGGDSEAFASIVERFQDMAVGYAYSKIRDMGVAEEVAQEAFLRGLSGPPYPLRTSSISSMVSKDRLGEMQ